jgi:hypothetical protein
VTPKIKPSVALAILGLTLASVASASAGTFTDSFYPGTNTYDITNDINAAQGSPRQTGVAGGVSYTEDASTATGGGADNGTQLGNSGAPTGFGTASLLLAAFNAVDVKVSPNINLAPTPTGSATVSFGVDPLGKNSSVGINQDDWAAVVFGATGQNEFVAGSTGIGFLLRGNGGFAAFDGGGQIAGGNYTKFPTSAGPETYQNVSATLTNTSGGGVVSISVNGTPITFNNSTTSYTRSSIFNSNYVSLEANGDGGSNNQSYFNNLRISNDSAAPVPEAASSLSLGLLLTLGGTVLCIRKIKGAKLV